MSSLPTDSSSGLLVAAGLRKWFTSGDERITPVDGVDLVLHAGEIVLIEVRENASVAEVIHLADPSAPIVSGDSLTLLPGDVWGASRAVPSAAPRR